MKHHQNGFTLVELAIALMIIGLLIGGVLKGQELIENARITRVAKNMADYDAAIMIFRNTYNALPGDVKRPSRIPNCTGTCAATVSSTGDGDMGSHTKGRLFWIHLERAGVISGINEDPTDTSPYCISPRNAFDAHEMVSAMPAASAGALRLQGGNLLMVLDSKDPIMTSPCAIAYLGAKRSAAVDQKFDDGKPYTGTARVPYSTDAASQCHGATDDVYATNNPTGGGCQFMIRLGSMN